MIKPPQLLCLFLAMALGSMPLLAQPAPVTKAAAPAPQGSAKTAPPPQVRADQEQEKKSTPTGTGQDSPFDYKSSEEISEDVPVSFPVDI